MPAEQNQQPRITIEHDAISILRIDGSPGMRIVMDELIDDGNVDAVLQYASFMQLSAVSSHLQTLLAKVSEGMNHQQDPAAVVAQAKGLMSDIMASVQNGEMPFTR